MSTVKETLGFQAEVKQLLQLMIHSLYSNKEIFLRELISNASDAADKLRFEAMTHSDWYESDPELKIKISFNKEARTITISDNGIGMSRDEVIANLGTIARSGTKEFFTKLSGDQQKDAALIGQFGVGFYSAFIVADNIIVETRRAGLPASEGVRWESQGAGEFTIETINRPERGTSITLHLREGEDELLSSWKLKSIIRKYSDHISLPIRMHKEEWDEEKKEQVTKDEFETINQATALWARPKSKISDEQYKEFYKHISHDFEDPLTYSHNRVEGRSEFTQLLFIPKKANFDLWDRNKRNGIKLYVKRVFIMDDAEQLMPMYLRFVTGVIDSADLPLNVSREILQESRDVKSIRESSTKRVLTMLEELANSEDVAKKEQYADFWKEFGQVLKEGIGEDVGNQERIAKLARFASTHTDSSEQTVTLADYVSRMKEGQDKIYYVTGESYIAAKNSPHLEIFKKKGVEVLLLSDRVDEWLLSYFHEFDGKALVSVAWRLYTVTSVFTNLTINRFAFPYFVSHKDDNVRSRQAYGTFTHLACLLGSIGYLSLLSLANPLLISFFGPQWEPAVPALKALALLGLLGNALSVGNLLLRALGRADLEMRYVSLPIIINLCLLPFTARHGLLAVVSTLIFSSLLAALS